MKIGAVIVTFNRLEKLKKALACYDAQTFKPHFILVVDNCSTDGTEAFLSEWEKARSESKADVENQRHVVNTGQNVGGSGGFYLGMQRAIEMGVEWVWVADDDAYPRPDAMERLSEYYEALPIEEKSQIVAVCSAVYNQGKIHFAHRNHVTTTFLKVKIQNSNEEEYDKTAFEFNMFSYVGSCIKSSALEEVGLDEKDYFIYRDDQEHSLRLNKVGKLICVPKSIVDHDTPPFDENEINWGKFYFKRNMLLMLRKNFPFRYFIMKYLKGIICDTSIFSRKDRELKEMYKVAYHDALLNKKGLNDIYRPGWKHKKSGGGLPEFILSSSVATCRAGEAA